MNLTENKSYWVREGAELEKLFIEKYGEALSLVVNPAKEKNRYIPDLLDYDHCRFADLKSQLTPFYSAGTKFGIDPRHAFTFDEYSALRYSFYYPYIDIYLWLKYRDSKMGIVDEVYKVPFETLQKILKESPLHIQSRRANLDSLNKTVFVFDVRTPGIVKV